MIIPFRQSLPRLLQRHQTWASWMPWLLCLLCYLPIIGFRDFSPSNEMRYLSIVDEALQSGHFFAFTFQGEPYADKPPLFFWAMMLCRWLFGGHYMLPYAAISALATVVTLLTMGRIVRRHVDPAMRRQGALMLLTCGLFMGMVFMLRADMLMVMFITLAVHQFCAEAFDHRPAAHRPWLFALYVFLAIFSKGVVGLLTPLLSIVAYCIVTRQWTLLSRFCGWRTWSALLGLSALWFGAVWLEGGTDYLYNLTVHQTVGRAVDAFHHKQPWYYYAVAIWYVLLPYSFLCIADFLSLATRLKRQSPLQIYLWMVVAVTLLFLTLSSGKLQVYLLPIFPFLIYLTLGDSAHWEGKTWARWSIALPAAIFACVLPAVLYYIATQYPYWTDAFALIGGAVFTSLFSLRALYTLFWRGDAMRALRQQAYAVLFLLLGGGLSAGFINPLIGYSEVCADARQLAHDNGIARYATCKIPRSETMSVYLGDAPQSLDAEVLSDGTLTGTLVIMKTSKYQALSNVTSVAPHFARYSANGQFVLLVYK